MTRPSKPVGLLTGDYTKATKRARVEKETALRPDRGLQMTAPARLDGHDVAAIAWRRLMREYASLEAEVVTRLDLDLLLDYCLLLEQAVELDEMRAALMAVWRAARTSYEAALAAMDAERALVSAGQMTDAYDAVVKIDARVDRKRSLLLQWRQSLYLTPRARAGAAPTKKEQEPPADDLELLLGEVATYVNGGGDGR